MPRAGELAAGELERAPASRTASTSRCPADPLPAIGRLHLITQTRREIEDVFIGLGFNVAEGPEVETVYYNFDALNHDADAPGAGAGPTPSTSTPNLRRCCCARTPARCRSARWSCRRRRSTSSSPAACTAATRRHAHPAVPPDRGSGGRRGHHARRPQGHAAGVRPGDLRARARDPAAPALLPVHRAERRGRRLVLQLHGRRHRRAVSAARSARARRGSRSSAPGWSTRTCSATSREQRLRPRAGAGVRVRDGDRADRDAQARRHRPAAVLRQRHPLPGAVRHDERPAGMAARVLRAAIWTRTRWPSAWR